MIHRKVAATATTILMSTAGLVAVTAGPAQANECSVTPKAGVSGVSVRDAPSVNSTLRWTLKPGVWRAVSCHSESGGFYSACGTGDHWFRTVLVGEESFYRYIAASCVRMVVDHG